MKVLYLIPQPKGPGRIAAYTFLDEEIHALAAAGIDAYVLSTAVPEDTRCGAVHVISADARNSLVQRIRGGRFLPRCMSSASATDPVVWYRTAWREYLASRIVLEQRIDLIHSHFAWPTGSGGMQARRASGRPLVASLRGTDILVDERIGYGRRANPTFDRALRGLLRVADRTVYFSEYMRNRGIALGARPEASRVVRKGVDLTHFTAATDRAALKRELRLPAGPMVLTVGGLIPRKGIDRLIEALARLRDRHDFTFVVCGDGPDRASLKGLSDRLGLGERTRFAGYVDREVIPKYFAACDLFALASSVEAAGNVLFEAMASARPVVCTNAGGPQEYVRDGETGFVVEVGDVEGLASRIGALLADPGLQDRLGQEGRRQALSELSYGRMVSDVIEVYEEVVRRPSRMRVAV